MRADCFKSSSYGLIDLTEEIIEIMPNFVVIILLVAYVGGVWKFWKGFKKTNFNPSLPNKLILSILWPALLLANKSYRKNFQKALKG